jgi:hypothetical protein
MAAGTAGSGHLRGLPRRPRAGDRARLAKHEFDLRVGQALASRTYAELAAVTADIPVGPTATQPPESASRTAGPSPRR